MKKSKKIMSFVHWDLDGVVSYLVLRWTFPNADIEYIATTVEKFRSTYIKWLSTHNLEDYDMVYIMDLAIYEDKELIDYPNVFIIDHHPGHDKTTYTKATSVIKNYTSACKLAFKVFKKLYNIQLTREQLYLIVLADDFDSYKLTEKESCQLNILFWDSHNKFESFIKSFSGGFKGFNANQANIIKIHDIRLNKIRKEIDVYEGTTHIQGKDRYVCAVFANQYINEVADILLNEYNAEVAFVVNIQNNHISYRRAKDSTVDLLKLAYDLAEGGGHEFSSGSAISDKFIEFSKTLEKI